MYRIDVQVEHAVLDIRVDDLRGPEVAGLLREHLRSMALHSPPESVHALDLDGLRVPEVTFWSAWRGSDLAGCAALARLDASHGEIKSMRTAQAHLRTGVAAGLVGHLLAVARCRGYRRLSLETGSMEAFAPARARRTLRLRALRALRGLRPRSLQRVHDAGVVASAHPTTTRPATVRLPLPARSRETLPPAR